MMQNRTSRLTCLMALSFLCNCTVLYDPATVPYCGNGIVEGSEGCDDGDTDDTDACTSLCRRARCGDGFIQVGELCDPPESVDGLHRVCGADCQWMECADGSYRRDNVSYPAEQCNGKDDDCDGIIEENHPDNQLDCDGDGVSAAQGDCNDGKPTCHNAMDFESSCTDALDNDCNDAVDGHDLHCQAYPGWKNSFALPSSAVIHGIVESAQKVLVGFPTWDTQSASAAGRICVVDSNSGAELGHVDGTTDEAHLGKRLVHASMPTGGIRLYAASDRGGVTTVQTMSVSSEGQMEKGCSVSLPVTAAEILPGPDFDNDGVADVVAADPSAEANRGCVFRLVSDGPLAGPPSSCALRSLCAEQSGDELGNRLLFLADVTGDGVSDVIASSPLASPAGRERAGSIWVIDGASWKVHARFDGQGTSWNLGEPLRAIPQWPNHHPLLLSGKRAEAQPESMQLLLLDPRAPTYSDAALSFSGNLPATLHTLRVVPDVSGDGMHDVAMAMPRAQDDRGTVWLLDGASLSLLDSVQGETAGEKFGSALFWAPGLSPPPEQVDAFIVSGGEDLSETTISRYRIADSSLDGPLWTFTDAVSSAPNSMKVTPAHLITGSQTGAEHSGRIWWISRQTGALVRKWSGPVENDNLHVVDVLEDGTIVIRGLAGQLAPSVPGYLASVEPL